MKTNGLKFIRPLSTACLRILFWLVPLLFFTARATAQDNQVIYADAFENGWHHDWSWGITTTSEGDTVHSGNAALNITFGAGGGTLWLRHYSFNPQLYQSLTFWVNGGATGGQNLVIQGLLDNKNQAPYVVPTLQANTWQQITVPLAELGVNSNAAFDGFYITSQNSTTVYIDDISLVGVTPPDTVAISINAASVVRTVDDRLFGVNLAMSDAHLTTTPDAQGISHLTPATATLFGAMNTRTVRYPGGSGADEYDWTTNTITDIIGQTFKVSTQFNGTGAFAQITADQNVQAFITVNYGSGTPEQAAAWVAYTNGATTSTASLGTDSKGRDWKTVGYWASIRAAAPLANDDGYNFLRISHPAPFALRYWELGNECYEIYGGKNGTVGEPDLHGTNGSGLKGLPHDAVTYANAFLTFRQKMLAVDPTIHLGADAVPGEDTFPQPTGVRNAVTLATHNGWTPVMLSTMQTLGIAPDFLIEHRYPQQSSDINGDGMGDECDATLLQSSAGCASDAADLRAQITAYLGAKAGAGVELTFTELNSTIITPGKQSLSLVNALYLADCIGVLAQTEINACLWWALRNSSEPNDNRPWLYGWRQYGDFGLVAYDDAPPGTPLNTPYPTYYAACLLTHWARGGDKTLATTTSHPGLTAYSALLANGNLALLVVNKSPSTAFSSQITTTGFTVGSSTGTYWQYGMTNDVNSTDLSTGNFANASNSFTYSFPAYSMTVLQLSAKAAAASPPVVTTDGAGGTGYDATTLYGTVNPEGQSTTCYFQYGLTSSYGSTTSTQDAGNGTTAASVNAAISGLSAGTTYHCQLVAINSSGTTYGSDQTFTIPTPPVLTTGSPTGTDYQSTTLNATVNCNGLFTLYHFQYGLTDAYGDTTSSDFGIGTTAVAFKAPLFNLSPGTTYYYQLVAVVPSTSGTFYGPSQTFTTPFPGPVTITGAPTGTDNQSTTLNGTVNPQGLSTTCYFQFGLTSNYGSTTSTQNVGNGTTASPVSAAISGLSAGTTYHCQLVATNNLGTTYGSDQTFTTTAPAPVVTTGAPTGTINDFTTLNGTVNPEGFSTTCYFQYGLTSNYGSITMTQNVGNGTTAAPTSASISGLSPATTYHFQLVATNSLGGRTYGSDQTFTTTQALDVKKTFAKIKSSGTGIQNGFQISIPSLSGYTYQLQRASILSSTTVWESVGGAQPGTNATLIFVDSGAASFNKAFYRIQISQ